MKFKKKFNTNENKIKTRKELRKEKRQEKKQKKNEYFSNRKQNKLQKDSLNKENNENRKRKLQEDIVVNKSENKKQTVKGKTQKGDAKSKNKENEESTLSMLEKQRIREKQAQKSIEANSKTARNKQLLNANREEEKEIRRLEKQLNMNKRKTKKIPSSFVSDGLDYLLELCDSDKRKELSEFESQQAFSDAESDFESDLAQVTGKKSSKGKITKRNKDSEDNSDDDQEDDFSGDEEDFSGDEDEMSGAAEFSENEASDNERFNEDSENESVSENQNDGQDEWEDDSIHESDFDDSDDGFGLEDNSEDESEEEFDNDEQVDSEEGSFDEELEGDEQYDSDDQDSDDKRDSHSKENAKKRKLDAANDCSKSGKKVKFADKVDANEGGKVLSKEERMKHLMGFVEKESKGKLGKGKNEKPEEKLSKEERMKKLMGFVEKESKGKPGKENKEKPAKEEKLSKEERMKKLMGFVEKESQGKPGKEKTLSREDRMKQLLGFVNSEEGKEGESGGEGGGSGEDNGTWEDIYGRLRDKDGNVVQTKATRYIPPHLRAAQSSNSESLVLLKRQLKGLLNRLTENNIKSIGSNVEQLYTQHSRHDMNETLLGLMRESLLSETLSPEKMMMEHVMLVTVLHANVGTEIGASLLQAVVQDFDHLYKSPDCHQVDNKRLDNHISFLIGLYQFKVLTHGLVYDILDLLIGTFDEKSIELILTILKTIGLSLRKDNAVRFKTSLLSIQSQANASSTLRDKPRTKFMLDILLAVKNNNVHKIPGYDIAAVLVKKSLFFSADEKGRWWIVGSAWSGADSDKPSSAPSTSAAPSQSAPSQFSAQIMELARKQRMNTDVRRNVFCVLMSSEDYLDAYEKLLKLGVRTEQSDDIVNVIVHCLLNEKQYNPYYTHLTQHFISSNRRYRMLVQYSVWDKFKLLGEMRPTQIVNLAKFLSALFIQHALPLSILKVIEFTELGKPQVHLVRQIFLSLLLLRDEETLRSVFGKIAKAPELLGLREGLHLFLVTFVLKRLDGDVGSEGERMKRNAGLVHFIYSNSLVLCSIR
ncbi:hypothetical protein M8J76_011615 [Diaphorina citri]|nr:hypothetical protein M8J76_011615 [Diaphorina citri]